MRAKNKIKQLLEQVPMDTREAKKELAIHMGCDVDKIYRLIRDPFSNISAGDIGKLLTYFKKYNPDIKTEDIIEFAENIA